MGKERPLQSMTIVIGPCWTNFCSQKLKKRKKIIFEDPIIRRRADVIWPPRSCDLTPLDYYFWGAVKDKYYADKPETIDALKDNIRQAIGEIQLHTIDNMLKNCIDRIGYCMALWMKLFSIINRKDCTFKKKKYLRKYSVVFF